jgi:protease IV
MKNFFKNILSTILGLIFGLGIIIALFFVAVGLLSSNFSDKTPKLKDNSILKIDLSKEVVERSSGNPFDDLNFMNPEPKKQLELKQILDNIEKAKSDTKIKGIYIYSPFINAGLSKTEEIRNKLLEFKKTGKPIISYNEMYSSKGYYLASVSDKVFLNPLGTITHQGLSATLMFFKEMLEKLNIDIQIFKVGKFKSAIEPLILEKMSDANRNQLEKLLNSFSENIFDSIASQRNLTLEQVQLDADQLKLTKANVCKDLGYIDDILYEDQVAEKMKIIFEVEKLNFISLSKYSKIKITNKKISRNKIAIIYANGDIISGKGNTQTIGSTTTSKAIRDAREDKNVKAIVLRVNSGGGSALASDVMWRETILAKKEKPFVVSMGDYAASGGYYIACAADTIVANPTTLTGSIGVFGMIPNLKNFYKENFGISIDTVNTNKYSDMGISRKLSIFEKNKIQEGVEEIYEVFLSRVARGRNMTIDAVDEIGQGRVWSGHDAKSIGLIDVYGGIEKAVEIAGQLARVEDYRIISLPKKADPLTSLVNDFAEMQISKILFDGFGFLKYQHIKNLKDLKKEDRIQARIPYLMKLE